MANEPKGILLSFYTLGIAPRAAHMLHTWLDILCGTAGIYSSLLKDRTNIGIHRLFPRQWTKAASESIAVDL